MPVVIMVLVAMAVLWLVSLIQVLTNPASYRNGSQLIWALVILLTGPLGAVLYQALGRVYAHPGIEALKGQERDRRRFLN